MKLEFVNRFSKNRPTEISNLMKIRPVGAELLHEDGQTDMTKLTVAFRNFANVPNKRNLLTNKVVSTESTSTTAFILETTTGCHTLRFPTSAMGIT
jgi:hypothetical protein